MRRLRPLVRPTERDLLVSAGIRRQGFASRSSQVVQADQTGDIDDEHRE
jgi:hypothetical protein